MLLQMEPFPYMYCHLSTDGSCASRSKNDFCRRDRSRRVMSVFHLERTDILHEYQISEAAIKRATLIYNQVRESRLITNLQALEAVQYTQHKQLVTTNYIGTCAIFPN